MGLLFVVFFLSGAASLIYQIVWMRQLSLIFGVTTFAVAVILAVFMGGLALGSYLFGRWSDKMSRHLLAYALLEVGIGAYALMIPSLFEALKTPYAALYQLDLAHWLLVSSRGVLAAAVLLPPTLLMGGTLPVLAKFLIRLRGEVGRQIALLYLVNTAGAVAGCSVAGFYLIEVFGVSATTYVAVGMNALLAALSCVMHASFGKREPASEGSAKPTLFKAISAPAGTYGLVLFGIGLSGFTSLAYEALWTRALLRYLHNSTYAFTTMLAVFLAGIALGSIIYLALPFRRSRPLLTFAMLQLGVAFGFLLSAVLFQDLQGISEFFLPRRLGSFSDTLSTLVLRSSLVLFLPALCLGAAMPLAMDIYTRSLDTAGETVGRVYAVNTLGAIFGALAFTFLMVPYLGMDISLFTLLTANLALGLVLLLWESPRSGRRVGSAIGLAAAFGCVAWLLPGDLFYKTFSYGKNVVFYKEGATDTVGVLEAPNGQRRIVYQDKRGTAGTMTYPWNYVIGHLPFLVHPGEPRTALHICFGVGNSLSAMARHESIESIDSIELSPHVLDAAGYFWTNGDVINDPRVNTIIDDGRNFLMASDRRYDVIELEPPEIFSSGVINLYTKEFYQDVYDSLNEEGVFVQWLPVGQAPLEDELMLFRAFFDVFPNTTVWQQLDGGPMLLAGSRQPQKFDYGLLRQKFKRKSVRRDLRAAGIRDVDHFLSLFMFGPEVLGRLVADSGPVTDDRTIVDFSSSRYLGSGYGMGRFAAAGGGGSTAETTINQHYAYYRQHQISVLPFLFNLKGRPEAVQARIKARPMPKVPRSLGGNSALTQAQWQRAWSD